MYLIIGDIYGYIEEKNRNKYSIFASADKTKEVLKKYTKIWDRIKNLIECNSIEKINGKSVAYGKDFIKIKYNSDDNLSLNKILKHHNLTVVVRSIFQEDKKYYSIIFFRWMFVWIINVRIWYNRYFRRNW